MTTDLPEGLREYIADLIRDDCDRLADHLAWLNAHEDEPDVAQQRAEPERAIELATKAASLFAPP
jgi:hypothetical protein